MDTQARRAFRTLRPPARTTASSGEVTGGETGDGLARLDLAADGEDAPSCGVPAMASVLPPPQDLPAYAKAQCPAGDALPAGSRPDEAGFQDGSGMDRPLHIRRVRTSAISV